MKFARVLLLLAAFQLEIRVRANSANEPLWQPEGCAKSNVQCHVQAGASALKLKIESGRVDASSNSILERKNGEWKVLTGTVRVLGADFETVYGRLLKSKGEAWIIADAKDRLFVRAIEGAASFQGRDGRVLEIPEGLELWVGSLDSDGQTQHGVPTEIPVEDHLRRVVRMDHPNKETLKTTVAELRERWKHRGEVASALYDQVAKRRLASLAEAEEAEAKKRAAAKSVRDNYRRMLHSTAFEK